MMDLERACTAGHPAYIRRSLNADEGWFLHGLVRVAQPPVVVEIGRLEGVSTQWIATALRDRGAGVVHSIDIETKKEATKRLAPFVKAGRVVVHEFSSHGPEAEALAARLGKIDFLFVDGDHRTEAVVADCALWLPHARRYVLFHDWGQEIVRNGIRAAVDFSQWDCMHFTVTRLEGVEKRRVTRATMCLLQRRPA